MVFKPKSTRKTIENEPDFRKRKSNVGTSLNKNLDDSNVGEMQADDGTNILYQLPQAVIESIDKMTEQQLSTEIPENNELIDSISFSDGKNILKIVFTKDKNRKYRIQVFLNDGIEIRPVTYTGSNTAETFWKLLKGSLK